MPPPIYIHFADTQQTFQAWRASKPLPSTSPEYAPHRQNLLSAARQLLPLCDPTLTPLILATTKGNIDTLTTWIRQPAPSNPESKIENPPTLLDDATSLAHDLALTAPAYVVSAACASGLVALIDAALTVQQNHAPSALVLGIDVAGSFVHDGFHALKALSTICRPFDKNRDGLALGSATAAALLSQQPLTHTACRLSGWAASADAVHLTAPDRHANGLIRAIRQALAMAQLQPQDIDVILAHGTGTRYNDAMEAVAFQTLFPAPKRPAITAVKGLIGHTLGASGLIESALAAQILAHQIIPPITNLQSPEYPDLDLVTSTRPAKVRHILKVASGFGGLNAAIVLSRGGRMIASKYSQILAGEGPYIWDLSSHFSNLAALNTLWHAPSLREAITNLDAKSLPPLEATPDLSQLSLHLATQLLAPIPADQRQHTAIILATTHGCLRSDIDFDLSRREAHGRFASPAAFRNTLPTHIPTELSVKLNLHGPVFTLSSPNPLPLALNRTTAWQHPLTLTGVFDWPVNAEPRAIFLLHKNLA